MISYFLLYGLTLDLSTTLGAQLPPPPHLHHKGGRGAEDLLWNGITMVAPVKHKCSHVPGEIRSEADRAAAEMSADAEAKATRIRGQGEAAAAQTLPVFQQEPELAAFLIRLGALEASLTDRTTLIFDQNSPPFDLLDGSATNIIGNLR